MITIPAKSLSIGMYVVSGLDSSWQRTPFLMQDFFIENEDQIHHLQQCCEYVQIDENQEITQPVSQTDPSTTALVKKRTVTKLAEDSRPFFYQQPDEHLPELAVYQPELAAAFFQQFGTLEHVAQGATILIEGQKAKRLLFQRDKMYFLAQGEVVILVGGKKLRSIHAGEIFGELTPLNLLARTATAIAGSACQLIGLDEQQLLNGLKQKPEFSLTLMSIFVKRLREAAGYAKASRTLPAAKPTQAMRVLNDKLLSELTQAVGRNSILHLSARQTLFRQGGVGIVLYIVLEGRVALSIDGTVTEYSGPGSVLGEIAPFDRKPRMAHAVADTDCALLCVNSDAVKELVSGQPEFGLALLRALASRLRYFHTGCSTGMA